MTTKAFSNAKIDITAKDKTQAAFSSVNKSLTSVTDTAIKFGGVMLAAAGIGGMGALIKSNLTLIDDLAKTSDRLNVTTDSLTGMRHAANLAGVSNETLDKSLEKLNVNLWKATSGTGAAADALDALNLSAGDLAGMPTDQALGVLADALSEVETASKKAMIAQDLFGRSGIEMINMLEGGSAALEEAALEADELGFSISRIDAAKVEMANDSFDKVKKTIGAVGQSLTIQLAPFITAVSESFLQSAKDSEGWAQTTNKAIDFVRVGLGWLLEIIRGIEFAWLATQLGFNAMAGYIMQGIEQIAKPIVKLLLLIPKLGVDYADAMAAISEATSNVTNEQEGILEKMDILTAGISPTERVNEWFDEVIEAAQERAEEIDEATEERREAQLESLEAHLAVEEALQAASSKRVIKEKKKALTDLQKFQAMNYKQQTAHLTGELENMTRASANSNKKMFEVNKAAGIANAVIGTYQGVAKSLGAYSYPINIAMAAMSLAAGLANVSAIKSVSFGGGGGAPSLGSGGGGAPTIPAEDVPGVADPGAVADLEPDVTEVTIDLGGRTMFAKEDIRDLLDSLAEELDDGAGISFRAQLA